MPVLTRLPRLNCRDVRNLPSFVNRGRISTRAPIIASPSLNKVYNDAQMWASSEKDLKVGRNKKISIKNVRFTVKDLEKIRSIYNSKQTIAQFVKMGITPEEYMNILHTAFVIYRYNEVKTIFQDGRKKIRSRQGISQLNKEWKTTVVKFQNILKTGGLRISEANLNGLSTELIKSKANHRLISSLIESGEVVNIAVTNPRKHYGEVLVNGSSLGNRVENYVNDLEDSLCGDPISECIPMEIQFCVDIKIKISVPKVIYKRVKILGRRVKIPWNIVWEEKTIRIGTFCHTINLDVCFTITCTSITIEGCATYTLDYQGVIASCTFCVSRVASISFGEVGDLVSYAYGADISGECSLNDHTVSVSTTSLSLTAVGQRP